MDMMKTRCLEILEKSQLPSAQAHAILKVMEMEIASVQGSVATKLDLVEVRSALEVKIADVKSTLELKIADVESALELKISDVKSEINKTEGALSRWVLTCMLGQTAVLAGLGYFVLEHLRR